MKINDKTKFKNQKFPLISKLSRALLILPHSTTSVERFFSQMQRLKTKDRNRMDDTLNACPVNFDF